jgi:hypothetical protein
MSEVNLTGDLNENKMSIRIISHPFTEDTVKEEFFNLKIGGW